MRVSDEGKRSWKSVSNLRIPMGFTVKQNLKKQLLFCFCGIIVEEWRLLLRFYLSKGQLVLRWVF